MENFGLIDRACDLRELFCKSVSLRALPHVHLLCRPLLLGPVCEVCRRNGAICDRGTKLLRSVPTTINIFSRTARLVLT